MHLNGYPLLLLMLLFAGIMPFLLMVISQVVQIKAPSALKYVAYESGMTPFGDAKIQFDVKFYLYALLFIVFDIETVFLFPWAVTFGKLGLFALVEMAIFIVILFVGLIYAWKKDALRWQ
ncbi:MAG: NADH-quinone oxidoreductase subunit A [Cyanobacteria bacterium]|nr:NADH-quinone oxidoreductase subunit A [Cyanobacteriota bacterium]